MLQRWLIDRKVLKDLTNGSTDVHVQFITKTLKKSATSSDSIELHKLAMRGVQCYHHQVCMYVGSDGRYLLPIWQRDPIPKRAWC